MDDLLKYVESWHSLVFVIVVFGFTPGCCLRLIVLAYPRNDPRRAELIAELYAVPRARRPLWVAEQLEVALFEGLAHRVSGAIRNLIDRRWGAHSDKQGVRRDPMKQRYVVGGVIAVGILLLVLEKTNADFARLVFLSGHGAWAITMVWTVGGGKDPPCGGTF